MIYWIVFFSAALASLIHFFNQLKTYAKFLFVFIYALILFIAGFKYASIDYFGYQDLFDEADFSYFGFPFYTATFGTTGMEFVWASFSSLFNLIGLPFTAWVFFVAFISVSIKFYYYKKLTPYFLLAVVVYISMSFVKDIGQLRNGLAGALLLFSIYPIIERKLIKFLFVILLAFGVQAYAIVALPLFWLYPIFKRARLSLIAILAILVFLSFFGGISEIILSTIKSFPLVPGGVVHKLESYTSSSSNRLVIFTITGSTYTLFSLFFLIFKNKILIFNKELFLFGVIHTYGLFLFLLFTGIDTLTDRSLDLLSMTSLPFLLLAPLCFSKGLTRLVFVFVIILFCGLKLYSNMGGFEPYQNILFL